MNPTTREEMFVVKRTSDGAYLCLIHRQKQRHYYTMALQSALHFNNFESAKDEAFPIETVAKVENELRGAAV